LYKKVLININLPKCRTVLVVFLSLHMMISSLAIHKVSAESVSKSGEPGSASLSPTQTIPARFGRVIYHHGKPGAKHLYIVGMGHRDTLTRSNGDKTALIQAEVYRIGEWLIENADIDLLLPEGYFSGKGDREKRGVFRRKPNINRATVLLDEKRLEEELGGGAYVNAEKLLMDSYGVPAGQVEDYGLYKSIVDKLKQMDKNNGNSFGILFEKMELDYLQDKRTAEILRNIPDAVRAQLRAGRITHGNAILTIGISHLNQIIAWLKQNDIIIRSPAFSSFEDYVSELTTLEGGFDITVIVPKTAAEDRDLMAKTSLADFIRPEKIAALKGNPASK
jgi:hypothetical protein